MALINCTACNHQISEAATTCPNCGHPNWIGVARLEQPAPTPQPPPATQHIQPIVMQDPFAGREPSMFGSYISGFFGGLIQIVGLIVGVIGAITESDEFIAWAVFAIIAVIFGGYLKYLSKHSVRVGR